MGFGMSAGGAALGWRIISHRWTPLALIAVGALLRLVWLSHAGSAGVTIGEALNVARAIATRDVIGDAFRVGQGPTAHVMPIPALIAGGVYKLLGVQSALAEFVLTLWALVLVFASFLLIDRSFAALGSPPLARVAALAMLCCVPLNFALETVWFRAWDGGLAVCLTALFLYTLVRFDGAEPSWRRIAVLAAQLALLGFVSPNFGVAGVAACAVFAIRNIRSAQWPTTIAITTAMFALVFAPWVARNAAVMGEPLILRSNAGLEMALAFNSAAAATTDPGDTFRRVHADIHPYEQGAGYAAMQRAGGEIAYSRALGQEARAWIADHPGTALGLAARHVAELLFPPTWYWTLFSDAGRGTMLKAALNWAISLLALAGLAWSLLRAADRRWIYPAILTLVTLLPYALVQPTLRYRYLVFALHVYYASTFCVLLAARWLQSAKGSLPGGGQIERVGVTGLPLR